MDESTSTTTAARSDALARATALAKRASELRRAQVEVQDLTAREVQVMARTAATFFEAIPLPEFSTKLLPASARVLRRMRHRILHRTVQTTATGTMIHAMLLGRDGVLRLFSARTADTRDLLLSLEPGRMLPPSVIRDVVEWSPMLRVSGFRPFEILERLSESLDAVEAQIADAEEKVQVQKQALESGDLKALLPGRVEARSTDATPAPVETVDTSAIEDDLIEPPHALTDAVDTRDDRPYVPVVTPLPRATKDPFDLFAVVEKVAATVPSVVPTAPAVPAAPPVEDTSRFAVDDDEPDEWDDPEPWDEPKRAAPPSQLSAGPRLSLFPVLPPPH